MAQFSAAITACSSESKYAKAYSQGVKKTQYWEVGDYTVLSNWLVSLQVDMVGGLFVFDMHFLPNQSFLWNVGPSEDEK